MLTHGVVNHRTAKIIELTATEAPADNKAEISRYLLRLYYYLCTIIKLTPSAIAELVYWDTGCSVTLIDRFFLRT